jgi:DNA-binding GntR family transcriptional regulator
LDALREAIVTGELKPGQPLVELDLAAQLGISRAPIREAIQILAREGLVETAAYRGTVVRRLDRTDIEELYSLRSTLETFALRRVIAQNNPGNPVQLRECFDDMLSAAQAGNLTEVNQVDRQFHDTLIALSNHGLLNTTWKSVALRVRQVMALRNRRNADITTIAYNHLPIIEAIEASNEDLGVRLLEAHIASSGDLLAESWDNDQAQGGP